MCKGMPSLLSDTTLFDILYVACKCCKSSRSSLVRLCRKSVSQSGDDVVGAASAVRDFAHEISASSSWLLA